jgi:hypothetical protein
MFNSNVDVVTVATTQGGCDQARRRRPASGCRG